MVAKDDRISLSVGNWIALAALALVPLGTLIGGWVDIKADAATTRVELRQLREDVSELKKAMKP